MQRLSVASTEMAQTGDVRGNLVKMTLAISLVGMTPRTGWRPPPPEGASSVVTGVLVSSGAFYTVTNSVLATIITTALAVALAVILPRRRRGSR